MNLLSINYKNTYNCKTLKIEDESIYDSHLEVDNVILEILPPGKTCFIQFPLSKYWGSKLFNCSLLELCCVDCPSSMSELPDGVYDMKYSIAPNIKTLVEFSHLRVCQLETRYSQILCKFFSNKCNYTKEEIKNLEGKLRKIDDTLQAAIYKVEDCNEKQEGLDLYDEANSLIKEFENKDEHGCVSCS